MKGRNVFKHLISYTTAFTMVIAMVPSEVMPGKAEETSSTWDGFLDRPHNIVGELLSYNEDQGTAMVGLEFEESLSAVGGELSFLSVTDIELVPISADEAVADGMARYSGKIETGNSGRINADKETIVKAGTSSAEGAPSNVIYQSTNGKVKDFVVNLTDIPEGTEGVAISLRSVNEDWKMTYTGDPAIIPLNTDSLSKRFVPLLAPSSLGISSVTYNRDTDKAAWSLTYPERTTNTFPITGVQAYALSETDPGVANMGWFGEGDDTIWITGFNSVTLPEDITSQDGLITIPTSFNRSVSNYSAKDGDILLLTCSTIYDNGLETIEMPRPNPVKFTMESEKTVYESALAGNGQFDADSVTLNVSEEGALSVDFSGLNNNDEIKSYMLTLATRHNVDDSMATVTVHDQAYSTIGQGYTLVDDMTVTMDGKVWGSSNLKTLADITDEAVPTVIVGIESVSKNSEGKYKTTGVKNWFLCEVPTLGGSSEGSILKDPNKCEHGSKWVITDDNHIEYCPDCDTILTATEPHNQEWISDDTYHWKKCKCGITSRKVKHNLAWTYDQDNHWQECECGLATRGQEHTIEWRKDGINRWPECTEANCKLAAQSRFGDEYCFFQLKDNNKSVRWVYCIPEDDIIQKNIYNSGEINYRCIIGALNENDELIENEITYQYGSSNVAYRSIYANGKRYSKPGFVFVVTPGYDGIPENTEVQGGFFDPSQNTWHCNVLSLDNMID